MSHMFTFIDLFAGIGGFRQAFESVGGKCVFSSEYDKFARKTYEHNYGELPRGDIREIASEDIPDFDVLCGGFPCQAFSTAGVASNNHLGKPTGFEHATGSLFFEVARIIRDKQPKAFMLENVKGLMSHDKGRTFSIIRQTIEEDLGYTLGFKVVNAAEWVPQNRERVFLVGYMPCVVRGLEIVIPGSPRKGYSRPELADIIEEFVGGHDLGAGTWECLQRYQARKDETGKGFGYRMHRFPIAEGERTATLTASYEKNGRSTLVQQVGGRPRKLTIHEAMQLQGFDPTTFEFPVSRTQAYKQIGNSVAIPCVRATALEIAKVLAGIRPGITIEEEPSLEGEQLSLW